MNVKKIYFDMDGVLADFDRGVIELAKAKPRNQLHSTFEEDKISWMHRILSKDIVINIVYNEQKKDYCTGPLCILIDDLQTNINEWRKLGGTGILHKNAKDTINELKKLNIL